MSNCPIELEYMEESLDFNVEYGEGGGFTPTPEELAAMDSGITAEKVARYDEIDSYIPAQASSENKLTDKEFVNSSIATNTAHYISKDGQPFNSVEELEQYSGEVTNNDYAFVTGTDEEGNTYYDRYKATVEESIISWAKEYRLNNSSFTAEQWAAISSGITSGLVALIRSAIQKDTDAVTGNLAVFDSDGSVVDGGISGFQAGGVDIVPGTDGKINVPFASYDNPGVMRIGSAGQGNGSIRIDNNGRATVAELGLSHIKNRYRLSSGALMGDNYDQAVKHAMCDAGTKTGDELGGALIWTASEQAAARERMGIIDDIRTTIDEVLVPNASYYLGNKISLVLTLPNTAEIGQQISVIFYSGDTATRLTVDGDVIGDIPTPSANNRYELNFEWDGNYWSLLYIEQEV